MNKTYWIIVEHYATPQIIRENHHLTKEMVTEEMWKALDEGYAVTIGID